MQQPLSSSPASLFLHDDLRRLSERWLSAPPDVRPRPTPAALEYFDGLVTAWANDPEMPLLVRKSGHPRGLRTTGPEGRAVIAVDNSPAQWIYALALVDRRPSIAEIAADLTAGASWLTKMLTAAESQALRVQRGGVTTRSVFTPGDLNKAGWKLAHISAVGLNRRGPLDGFEADQLRKHHRLLLSPSNMFLVPKELAGLGEVPQMCTAFSSASPTAPSDVSA